MRVPFKHFAQFLSEIENETLNEERLDEIWSKIIGKKKEEETEDELKGRNYVITAAKLKKEREEKLKKQLAARREEEWQKAKERMERGTRPGALDQDTIDAAFSARDRRALARA